MSELDPDIFVSAIHCDSILREENNVLTLVRIMDVRLIGIPPSPGAPIPAMATLTGNLYVCFKSVMPKKFEAVVSLIMPSGGILLQKSYPIKLEGAPHGHAILMNYSVDVTPEQGGIFWFEVAIGNAVYQRIPMEVIFKQPGTERLTPNAPRSED